MEEKNKRALNISSLVLGIISLISGFFYYISLPAGILAIIFGTISIRKTGSKMAKAGLILGIIGISICLFLYITMMIIISLI